MYIHKNCSYGRISTKKCKQFTRCANTHSKALYRTCPRSLQISFFGRVRICQISFLEVRTHFDTRQTPQMAQMRETLEVLSGPKTAQTGHTPQSQQWWYDISLTRDKSHKRLKRLKR
jgi:hypothetical protein